MIVPGIKEFNQYITNSIHFEKNLEVNCWEF